MLKVRNVLSSAFLILILGASVWLFLNWQRAIDQWRVWSFQPTEAVISLADRGGFSDEGKFNFYLARPEIQSNQQFNDSCRQVEKMNPVLGCHVSNTGADTIYILDVTNPELDGIKEVTAGHEMLHVVFSRSSKTEQERLSGLLEDAYSRLKTEKLEQRMDYYSRHEPGARLNELHSIIGTEFLDIGDDLEEYYAKYFTNRQQIVALHRQYSQKFEVLETESVELSAELRQRLPAIVRRDKAYNQAVSELNSRVTEFNAKASSGGFESIWEYEKAKNILQSEINALKKEKIDLQQEIADYNQKVERLEELGVKLDQLTNSLDSLSQDAV